MTGQEGWGSSTTACVAGELPAVRRGEGPALIEFSTHRYVEHCGPNDDDHLGYRKPGELGIWLERDPIDTLEDELVSSDQDVLTLRAEIQVEIDEAFAFAKESPFPDRPVLSETIYA